MGSNIWLSIWATSGESINGTMSTRDRDMYLGVYSGLGIGQGNMDFGFGLIEIVKVSIVFASFVRTCRAPVMYSSS